MIFPFWNVLGYQLQDLYRTVIPIASNIWLVQVFIVLFASFVVQRRKKLRRILYGLVKNTLLYCIYKF